MSNDLVKSVFGRSVFDDFFGDSFGFQSYGRRIPTNVKDKWTDDGYSTEIQLAGKSKDDITVETFEDTVYVKSKDGTYSYSFNVIGLDLNKIEAEMKNGLLKISIPKESKKEPETRKVAIR